MENASKKSTCFCYDVRVDDVVSMCRVHIPYSFVLCTEIVYIGIFSSNFTCKRRIYVYNILENLKYVQKLLLIQ